MNAKIEINGNLGFICSNNFPTNKRAAMNLINFLKISINKIPLTILD